MRRILGFVCGVFLVSFFACQNSREDARNTPLDLSFYKNVGKEIPLDIGLRWREAYRTKFAGARTQTSPFSLPAAQLTTVLQSISGLTGVAFHYGTDFLGITHIIAIPVDESLSLWTTIPGRVFIDTNTGLAISQSTAESWAQRYKNAHPTQIWFHYFGKSIFDEITSLSFLETVEISQGYNDTEQTHELLLIVWDNTVTGILGRAKDGGTSGRCYDVSNACPPCQVE